MAYMIYQRYTTAIIDGYRDDPRAAADHLEIARSHRRWLESLEIDGEVKGILVEQARVIEEAFTRLGRT